MWMLKAWTEWGVPWNWADRQGGWFASSHLTLGEDVGWWWVTEAGRLTRRPAGQPMRTYLSQVVSAQART